MERIYNSRNLLILSLTLSRIIFIADNRYDKEILSSSVLYSLIMRLVIKE